jgi:teichoic acid transport system permease protein
VDDRARTIDIERAELAEFGAIPSVPEYLRELWRRREYAVAVPMGDLRAMHMNTVLGNLWHLINPLLMVGVYYLVFGLILDTTRGIDNFITFLAVGIFTFRFTQNSIQRGASTIVANDGLIRSIYFPRAILPLATVVEQVVLLGPVFVVTFVILLLTGESPSVTWLLLPIVYALQSLFNLGGAFVAARITDSFKDFQNVVPFVFRIIFYLSGVLYSVEAFIDDPTLLRLFELNPAFCFVTMARWTVLDTPLPLGALVSAIIWSLALLVGGFLFFRAAEPRYGRG